MAILADYLGLLPSANASQPNFVASISAALQPLVDIQNTLLGMPAGFDLANAVGVQLDAVGQWVGLSRGIDTPLAVYFTFDTSGLGFDQGVWFGPSSASTGVVSLDDETYRLLLQLKIVANGWDGSLAGAQAVMGAVIPSGTYLLVQDNFDMSMSVCVAGVVPSTLFVSLIKQTFGWVRPAAVNIAAVLVTSVSGTPLFGFDVQNAGIGGFDTGAWPIYY